MKVLDEKAFEHTIKFEDLTLHRVIGQGASVARTALGTPQYWSPEVLEARLGGGSYDQRADFWSLGAMLYVMLCGKYPFDGKTQFSCPFTAGWPVVLEYSQHRGRPLPESALSPPSCRSPPWPPPDPPGAAPPGVAP